MPIDALPAHVVGCPSGAQPVRRLGAAPLCPLSSESPSEKKEEEEEEEVRFLAARQKTEERRRMAAEAEAEDQQRQKEDKKRIEDRARRGGQSGPTKSGPNTRRTRP